MMQRAKSIAYLGLALTTAMAALPGANGTAQIAPGGPVTPYVDPAKAYLFLHMTKAHYGALYYSVSLDGLHWRQVNGGEPVSADYHGHASVARGGDGRYYL